MTRIVAASPGPDVLDAGCGTGIAARLFQAAGCRMLGVHPDPRMAELGREAGTEVEVARLEDWDPAGRTFDAVIAAQAWHWVDPVTGAAKAASVLRPGGRLAVFWNVFEPPAALREAFAEVFRHILPDSPFGAYWSRPALDGYRAGCARAADGMRQAGGFGEPGEWLFNWERPYTRDEWLDMVPTTGGFSQHPEAAQRGLLEGLGTGRRCGRRHVHHELRHDCGHRGLARRPVRVNSSRGKFRRHAARLAGGPSGPDGATAPFGLPPTGG